MQAMHLEGNIDRSVILGVAIRVHNHTPHVALKASPFESLFGRPPYAPGTQAFHRPMDETQRRDGVSAMTLDRLRHVALRNREMEAAPPSDIAVGDVVVARVNPGAATQRVVGMHDLTWLSPPWSLPMRVTAVTPTQVTLQLYGDPASKPITVHKADVKKFTPAKTPPLRDITREYITRQLPSSAEVSGAPEPSSLVVVV